MALGGQEQTRHRHHIGRQGKRRHLTDVPFLRSRGMERWDSVLTDVPFLRSRGMERWDTVLTDVLLLHNVRMEDKDIDILEFG